MQPRVAQRIQEAQAAVTAQPDSPAAWGNLGMILHVHREHTTAADCYRRAHELDPNDFRWVYFLARVLELQGHNSEEVLQRYFQAIKLRPSYAPVHARAGDALVRAGRLEDGRQALERAVSHDANLAKAQRSLGQVLLMLNDLERAVVHLEAASRLQPADGATWAALAQAYARTDNQRQANAAAEKAAAHEPIHALIDPAMQVVTNLGISSTICAKRARAYLDRGDFEQALQQFLIVAEVETKNANLQHRIATTARSAGRSKLAKQHLQRAIDLSPDNAAFPIELANWRLQDGELAQAVAGLKSAVSALPNRVQLLARLGSALAQSGEIAEALATFDQAAQLGDLPAREYANWGNALYADGQLERAVSQYERALQAEPDYANGHYNLGSVLEQLDRDDEALEHYRAAVNVDPNHPAKQRIAQLMSAAP